MDFVTHLPWTSQRQCGMGYYGMTYQVGTFSGCADDLHTGGILQVVC